MATPILPEGYEASESDVDLLPDPPPDPRCVQPPPEMREYAAKLIRELGPRRAAARLHLSRPAALGVAIGAPVRRGTVALMREAMRGQRQA
jgi:hypothetical protein